MPHGEKPKGKSWSLRNMLGRKRAKNGASSPAECASVKERVLAKLQEPLSNEKEAARYSVDELRAAPMFSPRLSCDGHQHFSQLKDAFAAAGQGYGDAQQPSRHSTSFWQFEREPVQSRSSSSAFQASPSSASSAASTANMRSTQQGFSSPASNVIARLMGLEELDSHGTSHIKLKHSLRAEASSSESRQGAQSTRQEGHTGNEPRMQQKSPCLQPKQPRARGSSKSVEEEVTRSPKQQRHVFLSHGGCIAGNEEDEKRSPQAHTRGYRMERGFKDPAQDFLDEMEEELKQCDKALERIEAAMQLKKRLLYLSRSAGDELEASCQDVAEHNNFVDYTKADLGVHRRGGEGHMPIAAYSPSRLVQDSPYMSRCNGRAQRESIYSQHVRAHSLDHRQRVLLWEEEQSWEEMQQLPEDEYYSSARGRMRSKKAGTSGVGVHHPQMKDNMTNLESQSPRSLNHQPQMPKRFLHRRSVSDGETPVFSLTEGTYNLEAARACITKVMAPSSPVFNNSCLRPVASLQFCKDSELLYSDVPKTPDSHKPQNRCLRTSPPPSTEQYSGDKQKMTKLFQVEDACMLSRSRPQIQHKPVPDTMCEQPSPVSVLDNAEDDSPRSSEDYEDFKPAKSLENGIDEVGDEIKRKSAVRALWRTDIEKKPEEEAKGRSHLVFRSAVRIDHANFKDEELVKEMQQSWSGFSSEIAEVAVAVECMILKKLVEETIILYMMMP